MERFSLGPSVGGDTMTVPSYAYHGSEEFNARFHETVQAVAKDVEEALGDNLLGLVLGGGYGRGEGSVINEGGVEQPYNDLDFLLVVQHPGDVDQATIAHIKAHHETLTPLHVDFTQPMTVQDLQKWPPWLMWHDFLNGHIVSSGDPQLLHKHVPKSVAGTLAPIEACRLLINRGAGLLWAMRIDRGLENKEDADFIKRNYWKCALALGDALLIAHNSYTTSYRGRDKRFKELSHKFADISELDIVPFYDDALHFKFSPHEVTKPFDILEMGVLTSRVFLYIEQRRFKRSWADHQAYAKWKGLREPEEHVPSKWTRNLYKAYRLGEYGWRYPIESVYRALPGLLYNTKRPGWEHESDRCLQLWKGLMGVPINEH